MKSFFSIGEVAKQQDISRQTLIFYDKIGLFSPAYVDEANGYRYYSAAQLDTLDTILIMKKIGFSLEEIKKYIKSYNIDTSIVALRKQLAVIDSQIKELQMIKSRVEHRCSQLEQAVSIREDAGAAVTLENMKKQYILIQLVDAPYSLEKISLATKECFVRSFKDRLPIFFQSGAIVPYKRIMERRYTEASFVFLPIEKQADVPEIVELPEGRCVASHHIGDYLSIGSAYERILNYCAANSLKIISDSYEFAVNDYLSTGDEDEYITKVIFYVEE